MSVKDQKPPKFVLTVKSSYGNLSKQLSMTTTTNKLDGTPPGI